uniref:[RNA-polymerase]-subunit kinase n=1 Tax=Oryza nivara TaxID=4536 RepID=A0A0E0IPK4_ORYNI
MAPAVASRKRVAADDPEPRSCCGSSQASGPKRRRYNFGSADDYERLDVVGQGAFGVVVRARDRRTGKVVALKRLIGADEGGRFAPNFDALRLEAACQHACRGHPNIVQIKDVVADAKTGDLFLVLEFVGGSLRDEFPRARPEDIVRAMMRPLVVALKRLIGADEGGRFSRDFDALRVEAACQHACRGHPNIVQIKDVVADAKTGDLFLVLEFVGGSLRDEFPRARPEDIVRAMMRPLVDAAKKMHASRVIHRDIKPDNILVSFSGQLKVCDFGAATLMKPAGKPYDLCRPGTLPYTSPEQLAGNRCYGPAVDMWALGCIMGELLTGAPLFGGDMTEKELLADLSANLGDQLNELFYDVLPELSPAAREVLSGLLAFDPEKRMTAVEALEHRWFADEPKKAEFPGFVPLFG